MDVKAIRVVIPSVCVLNLNQREGHWASTAKRTRTIRTLSLMAARGREPFTEPVRIVAYLHFADNRRRDPDNWAPTTKACIDGFVDAGLLADDDHKHVIGPDRRIGERGKRGELGITFEFLEVE